MKTDSNKNRIPVQILVGSLLCVFLIGLFYILTFRRPSVLGLGISLRASGTRTAIALTSRALYGPFPTATGPTPTPSKTRTITPSPTLTPTNTDTPTAIHYYIDTATPRTPSVGSGSFFQAGSTPTSGVPPANPVATNPPPQPTNPPVVPTSVPIQPTPQAPKPTPCSNPQGHPIPCH